MPDDRQILPVESFLELWTRGRLWEIFGFTNGDFTALELAAEYSRLVKLYKSSPEEKQVLEDAFAILNAPLTRRFFEGCRMEMERIRHEIGDSEFEQSESKIWADLWGWVSRRWQPPPEGLISAANYMHLDAGEAGAFVSRAEAPIRRASWFERHLNWTAILIGLAIPLLGIGVGILSILLLDAGWSIAIVFALGGALLVTAIWAIFWLLKKKRRSWAWSLLVFVPYIGWFLFIAIYLDLENRSRHWVYRNSGL